ncbi:DUF6477 family protein [Cognatishimia sp. MH4019]|uniref:DUF6477 family protein n=1 Tax=Cognatishimia sp. MH4019 TaxID=2854030 RepID=UPI001CD53223|nr:DUF6477 family protein [Cognatishimia sp. MH4019]
MTDILARLECLRRPRLLMSAARFGVLEYRRTRDLARILQSERMIGPVEALTHLIDIEGTLEEQRVTDDGRYNLTQHVLVMIAIMGEARMVQAARAPLP